MILLQVSIAIFGFVAIYLTQQPDDAKKKYACIFGLISQPMFLYSTFMAEQWGMFLLSIAYTYAWWVGFKSFWLKKQNKQ